jgi:ATP-dependent RNA helicase DeaD
VLGVYNESSLRMNNANQLFTHFPLSSEIINVLNQRGFVNPTEIQVKAFKTLLGTQASTDFHGKARTGTGKTLAFGLPLIEQVDTAINHTQGLVIAPTRELVVQITQSLQEFCQARGVTITNIYGGVSIRAQRDALRRGAHIVVATPGRLLDHLQNNSLSLKHVKVVVLDEADIMLDMGFKEDVDLILSHTPVNRSIWLFSATTKPGIAQLINTHMKEVVRAHTDEKKDASLITQCATIVPREKKLAALERFLECQVEPLYCIIFCATKIETSLIAQELIARGYTAQALHGDIDQKQRNKIIEQFRNKTISILVATDVAARGIDVPGVTHVFNFGVPDDMENYVHRIGRTGRAGDHGVAISIIEPSRRWYLQRLTKRFGINIQEIQVPSLQEVMGARGIRAQQWLNQLVANTHKSNENDTIHKIIQTMNPQECSRALALLLQERFFANPIGSDDKGFSSRERTQEKSLGHSRNRKFRSEYNNDSRFEKSKGSSQRGGFARSSKKNSSRSRFEHAIRSYSY